MQPPIQGDTSTRITRVKVWYGILLVVFALFILRLFYLQVIRHSYYRTAALSGQFKENEIPAERGVIEAHNGEEVVPIVLNETKYTAFADPKFIENTDDAAGKIQSVIGGNIEEIKAKITAETRYSILAKKLDKEQKQRIDELNLKGVGTREERYRTYPQGTLAAQLLGFVNDENEGKYGIEQYLNNELKGQNGQLKAITDAKGVPLLANKDNVMKEPMPGKRVVLTIDVSMQKLLEEHLKRGIQRARSPSGGAFIMDIDTGAIKAMANYPTYNPAEFYDVKKAELFNNSLASSPLEVGSVMKPLTMAAALDTGAVKANQSFYDPGHFKVDNAEITNVEESGGFGQRSIVEILTYSLNTGATWLLMQMGGGQINEQARTTWHDYMTNHYRLGKTTGIEQGFEAEGSIPSPTEGFGLNIQYANTAFGQGMSATPLQIGGAFAAVLNGGTYYQPRLIDKVIDENDNATTYEPKVLIQDVVNPNVSKHIQGMMEAVIKKNYLVYGFSRQRPDYRIGGKTGTAQITKPGGGYFEYKFNGMFVGFVGGDKPEYLIVVRANEPNVPGYAGSKAAGPIFVDLANMLIDNFNILPKSR